MSAHFVLAVSSLLTLVAGSARADTLHVPGDSDTIQGAVDLAAPGDVIQLKGRFDENVVIPAGLDGLVVRGPATIDAHLGDHAITVDSEDVRLEKLTLRHALDSAVLAPAAAGSADGLRLKKVTFIGNHQTAAIDAQEVSLEACTSRGDLIGVAITGNDALVQKLLMTQQGNFGVSITGNAARVLKSEFRDIGGASLFIDGDGAKVTGNQLTNGDGDAIVIEGAQALVEDNTCDSCGARSLFVLGADAVIRGNKVRDSRDLSLIVSGDAPLVDDNLVSDQQLNLPSINVISDTGAVVTDNRVTGGQGRAMLMETTGAVISGNRLQDAGVNDDEALRIAGEDNTVQANVIERCEDTGIAVTGDGNTLLDNIIRECTDNGVQITFGEGNVLDGNTITGCHGEGLENIGVDTLLIGNVLKKNRLDVTNAPEGNLVDGGGNVFTTGGFTTEPEID